MAGRSGNNAITKYPGLQVQTSSMGLQIPLGWGTFRCKCNLLDYQDFKAKQQKAQAGKGGSVTTGFSYSATILLAICEGTIDSVKNVYVNGKVQSLSAAGLTLATGAIGQAVWSYMTTNHLSHALGYSGIAYAYASNYTLGNSASPPNHSFEIVRTTGFAVGSSADIDPSLWMTDFFTNAKTGVPLWGAGLLDTASLTSAANSYQAYCLAAGLLISPLIDGARQASEVLKEVLAATNSTVVWSEGVLKFIPYGDTTITGNGKTYTPNTTPVYVLNDDNYIVKNAGDPPVRADIEDQSDAYNVVQVEFLNRNIQYNMDIALASDQANAQQFGRRPQDPTPMHCICDPAVAQAASQLLLQRTLYVRGQYKTTLGYMFELLEPGDILGLNDTNLGLTNYGVRIIQIDENEDDTFDLICEDFPIGTGHTPLYTIQTASGDITNMAIDPGGVEANLALWSQDFTQATYTKTNVTIGTGASATTDPYGVAQGGQALQASAANGLHSVSQDVAGCFAGANYTLSVFLKANTRKIALVRLSDTAETNAVQVTVDTSAGTVFTAANAFGTGVLVGSTYAQYLSTGWWQVTITGQFPAITTLRPKIYLLDDTGNTTWTGDGTHGVYAWGLQLHQGVAVGAYAATTSVALGPYIFNPPSVLTIAPEAWAAVAGDPNWGGCNVWTSTDGTNYELVNVINGPARYGLATTSFASHADPDTTNTVGVDLGQSSGALTTAAQSVADNGGTLCLLDSELICFEVATLTNPSRYTLGTYTRRGFLNSPVAAHSVGAPFVRLDNAIAAVPYMTPNVGVNAYVKFQSFNLFGLSPTDLANCNAYRLVPLPVSAAAPAATDWTAIGTTISNGGVSIPAVEITGNCTNPNASQVEFDYRVTGAAQWNSWGQFGPTIKKTDQTNGIASGQTYDISVVYWVAGVPSARTVIASGLLVGNASSGFAPGSILLDTMVTGAGLTFTCQAGSYAHVDVVLVSLGGDGNFQTTGSGKSPPAETGYGGSGASTAIKTGLAVTAGTTVFTYTLPTAIGTAATCTATGLNLSCPSGITASTSAAAAAPANATGGTTNQIGHAGGLVDTWDGGGSWWPTNPTVNVTSGGWTDQTTQGNAGTTPGGGGAGAYYDSGSGTYIAAVHSGARLLIVARA